MSIIQKSLQHIAHSASAIVLLLIIISFQNFNNFKIIVVIIFGGIALLACSILESINPGHYKKHILVYIALIIILAYNL